MSTDLDGIVLPNAIPARLNRKAKKILKEVKDEIDESIVASAATKQNTLTMAQGTTGTGGSVGKITIAGMTSSGVVVAVAAESPGTEIVLSHVVAGSGIVTVFAKDTSATGAATELSGKKINYIVVSL